MSAPRPAFPWQEAMGFAFGVLRLPPEAFWAMTPRELAAAIRAVSGRAGGQPLPRTGLDRLMQAFPDTLTTIEKET